MEPGPGQWVPVPEGEAVSVPRKPKIGIAEQVARVVVGEAFVLFGIAVLSGGPAFWGFVGAVVAVAAGLDLVVTGALGYRPPYATLAHVPRGR